MVMQLPVSIEGNSWPTTELTAFEMDVLQRQVLDRKGEIAFGNGFLQDLYQDNAALIIEACKAAKHAFGDVAFKGLFAGDSQFGVTPIQPAHVLRTTDATETAVNDWTRTFTADGDYWIGYSTNNTTAINIDKRLLVLILGVAWSQGWAPIVEKIQFQIGNNIYPYQSVRHGWYSDNQHRIRAARLRPMILGPKDTVLAQIYSLVANDQEMELIGLSFAKGDLLRAQAPTTIQT